MLALIIIVLTLEFELIPWETKNYTNSVYNIWKWISYGDLMIQWNLSHSLNKTKSKREILKIREKRLNASQYLVKSSLDRTPFILVHFFSYIWVLKTLHSPTHQSPFQVFTYVVSIMHLNQTSQVTWTSSSSTKNNIMKSFLLTHLCFSQLFVEGTYSKSWQRLNSIQYKSLHFTTRIIKLLQH